MRYYALDLIVPKITSIYILYFWLLEICCSHVWRLRQSDGRVLFSILKVFCHISPFSLILSFYLKIRKIDKPFTSIMNGCPLTGLKRTQNYELLLNKTIAKIF
jgi:hypothetical protein